MIDVGSKLFHAVLMEYKRQHIRTVCIKRLANRLSIFLLSILLIYTPMVQAAFMTPCLADPCVPDPREICDPYECYWAENLYYDIKRDFTVYLRPNNLLLFGDALVVGGILANTRIDRSIRNTWQESVRSNWTNNFFAIFNDIGGFSYWYFAAYPAAVALGYYTRNSTAGNAVYFWGYRSLRTALLGGIQQAFFTQALGSGRPSNHVDSKWQPFKYKTGVSGHAFYGAIPFLTAAMMSDPPLIKYGLYILSTLPGLARINNDSHYTSQVFLGWAIAFLSARAIYQSDSENETFWTVDVCPYRPPDKNAPPGIAVRTYYHF